MRQIRHMPLPVLSTLRRWMSKTLCMLDLQFQVLQLLREKLDNVISQDRCAVICIDEMSIRQEMAYCRASESVLGPSKKVLVIMLRGLYKKWKQPIYFDCDTCLLVTVFLDIVKINSFVWIRHPSVHNRQRC